MLDSAGNALEVFQQALNVTQNNINNASTPGYATQTMQFEAEPFDLATGLGGGVSSGGLDNSRDTYAEEQLQAQTQLLGQYSAQAQATGDVQSLFDTSGNSGVAAALTGLFQSFSAWSASPTDPSAQQSVLTAASNLASSIQGLQSSLSGSAQKLNGDIASTAAQINNLSSKIAALNAKIAGESTPDPGTEASLYSALDNLSQLTNFSTVPQANGTLTVVLAGGSPLVLGSQADPISVGSANGGTQILDSQGNDITSQITSGQLGGMLSVQQQVLGPMLGDSQTPGTLDQLTSTLADAVNGILESGTVSTATGAAAGTALFTYSASDPAATIQLNPSITAAQLAPVDSSGNANGNANQLAALDNSPLSALGGMTPTQYFAQMASAVGQANQTATDNQSSQQQVVSSATSLINQISGVSLDQQAVNVLQFQHAYQAIAQVVTVINNITASLMNLVQPNGNG